MYGFAHPDLQEPPDRYEREYADDVAYWDDQERLAAFNRECELEERFYE